MSLIILKNINKTVNSKKNSFQILKNINLTIHPGEMVAIMGSSGAGKTTLLNIISGLDQATSGEYIFKNLDITKYTDHELAHFRNKDIGIVLQDFALIDRYTVKQNISLPLHYSKKKYTNNEKKTLIENTLTEVNLKEKENIYVYELSGGQKQRVAIARAIINKPTIIIADEPTGSLDSSNANKIIQLLKKLNQQGNTIIIVTHEPKIAKECTRIITIHDGTIRTDTAHSPLQEYPTV